jgi:hypothetical protein
LYLLNRFDRMICSCAVVIASVLSLFLLPSVISAQAPDTVGTADISAHVIPIDSSRIPAPVASVRAEDRPDDNGNAIDIVWEPAATGKGPTAKAYSILRAPDSAGHPTAFVEIGRAPAGAISFSDGKASTRTGFWALSLSSADTAKFYYKVVAINDSTLNGETLWSYSSESQVAGPVSATAQWFNGQRRNVLVGLALLCIFIIYYINRARAGKELFIRKIAGLEAVNEAVGRATEMGRKILYIPGTSDMDNVQTLAAITILGHVAGIAAQYETHLDVPVSRSLVMVACREVLREAYAKAGRSDSFHEDQAHYLTDDQFGYAAAIDGMVVREKPATIFLLGNFYAEALILAETGNSAGAIQIAGTGEPSQLPFFVAACDYTLIGEELFAASAYLSREPRQLGSLKGQDIGKGLILILIFIGVLLATFHIADISSFFKVIN